MRDDGEYGLPEEEVPRQEEQTAWEEAQEACEQDQAPYEPEEQPEAPRWQPKPYGRGEHGGIISTNLTINLICTLGAMSGPLGLFLYFADKRSQAVRRYAVQSSALFFVYVVVAILCYVLGALLGVIPILGGIFKAIFNLVWAAVTIVDIVARVKMMLHAYAGEAYVLPVIGEQARSFE